MADRPAGIVCTSPVQRSDSSLELADDFSDTRASGRVIGTLSTSGHQRLGTDIEGVLSIDNGALRIAPLIDAGFGRAAISYGPFATRPGLALAVFMLNGHNTAQSEPLTDTFLLRLENWLKGSETDPRISRLFFWLRSGHVRRVLRQFRRWKRTAPGRRQVPLLDENLAVGWFPDIVTPDPREEGNAFIMHALGPENGELWTGVSPHRTRSLRGVQNLPFYYISVLRQEGAVYYTASLDGAVGSSPYPWFRPVALDSREYPENAYVCVHQSVLGQIGWRIDTRVHGVRVAELAGYGTWCGGAHAADRLSKGYVSTDAESEIGGPWQAWQVHDAGSPPNSVVATIAVLDPGAPSGLIHAVVTTGKEASHQVGLVWRLLDQRNHWRLVIKSSACDIVLVTDGNCHVMASRALAGSGSLEHRLQVLDDGNRLMAYVDGEPLLDAWLVDSRLQEATKTGIIIEDPKDGAGAIGSFEAHPRQIRIPDVLDMGRPWLRKGTRVVVADDFTGEPADLDGRITPVGDKCWSRVIGQGHIEIAGDGLARVRTPCPGRTAYCVDWNHADFVDLEVTITPSGNKSGKNQTTAGFILYQDSGNYVTLNAYRADYYPGGSVSTFFKFNGFEDIYDAVWVNVGDRIAYGRPSRLRLCCDGTQYIVFVNDEAVLYRAFSDVYPDVKPLRIRKVGIIANWEFGTDTGSTFKQCKMRV